MSLFQLPSYGTQSLTLSVVYGDGDSDCEIFTANIAIVNVVLITHGVLVKAGPDTYSLSTFFSVLIFNYIFSNSEL